MNMDMPIIEPYTTEIVPPDDRLWGIIIETQKIQRQILDQQEMLLRSFGFPFFVIKGKDCDRAKEEIKREYLRRTDQSTNGTNP